MAKVVKTKTNYSLAYRTRSKLGIWSDWMEGKGQWIDIETVQNQIKMLRQNHSGDMEIRLSRDGRLLDYRGKETGEIIKLDERTR